MEIEIPHDLFCLLSWSCDLLSEFEVFGTDFTLRVPNDIGNNKNTVEKKNISFIPV